MSTIFLSNLINLLIIPLISRIGIREFFLYLLLITYLLILASGAISIENFFDHLSMMNLLSGMLIYQIIIKTRFSLNIILYWLILFGLILIIYRFELSGYYYSYLLCANIIIISCIYCIKPTNSNLFFLVIAYFFAFITLAKYVIFFFAFSILMIISKCKFKFFPIVVILGSIFLAVTLAIILSELLFDIGLGLQTYSDLSDFVDTRITRESNQAVSTGYIAGVSDGGRFGLWLEYINSLSALEVFFGTMLTGNPIIDVPPHNLLISIIVQGGLIFLFAYLLTFLYFFMKLGWEFQYLAMPIFLFSLVSEGILQPFYFFTISMLFALVFNHYKHSKIAR